MKLMARRGASQQGGIFLSLPVCGSRRDSTVEWARKGLGFLSDTQSHWGGFSMESKGLVV